MPLRKAPYFIWRFGDLSECLSSVRCLENINSHGCAAGRICQLLMAVNKEKESSQVALANVIVCCHWRGGDPVLFPSCSWSPAVHIVPTELPVRSKFIAFASLAEH